MKCRFEDVAFSFFPEVNEYSLLHQFKCAARILDIKMCCFLSDLVSKTFYHTYLIKNNTLQLHVVYLAFFYSSPQMYRHTFVLPKTRHCNKKRHY